MKRVTLVLAGLLCAAALTAQARPPRTQTGNATQEMQTTGLSAAHNSLPIGSKARIRNLSNGREIEVTITEYIPTSTRRIIDLSPSAAIALELGFGGPVIVTPLAQTAQEEAASQPQQITDQFFTPAMAAEPPLEPVMAFIPEPEPEMAFIYEPEPEPVPVFIPEPEPIAAYIPPQPQQVSEADKSSLPYTIIINNYIVSPEDMERLQKSGVTSPSPYPLGEGPYLTAQPPSETVNPSVSYSLFTAPPVKNIKVIPALPNPHSGKTYRLLVGIYPGAEAAFRVYHQLQVAGFDAVQEQAGNTCRVLAVGIPASSVYYATQRLGAIGFEQVWVYE